MAETNNKIVLADGTILMDLTQDSVSPDKLLSGITAHDKSGAPITGSCLFDADTSDADANASELLSGRTAYVNGVKVTGTMPNNGSASGSIATKEQVVTPPAGYYDGSGGISIAQTEQDKLIPGNIKAGVQLLGVTGTLSPASDVTAQTKSAAPSFSEQTILPDSGYDYLSQVTITAISVVYTENAAGGNTVTIG